MLNPLTDEPMMQNPFVFKFDKWIVAEQIYESGIHGGAMAVSYSVSVKTADKRFAGTNDNVFIDIIGTRGRTQYRKLITNWRGHFERGKTDSFQIDAVDLGELKKIKLIKP